MRESILKINRKMQENLNQNLQESNDETNAQKRGRLLEELVYYLALASGLKTWYYATVQTKYKDKPDLHIEWRGRLLLVECKNYKILAQAELGENKKQQKADFTDITSFYAKLRLRSPNTIGLFISNSGYSSDALEYARFNYDREVIFLERDHIEALLRGNIDLDEYIAFRLRLLQRGLLGLDSDHVQFHSVDINSEFLGNNIDQYSFENVSTHTTTPMIMNHILTVYREVPIFFNFSRDSFLVKNASRRDTLRIIQGKDPLRTYTLESVKWRENIRVSDQIDKIICTYDLIFGLSEQVSSKLINERGDLEAHSFGFSLFCSYFNNNKILERYPNLERITNVPERVILLDSHIDHIFLLDIRYDPKRKYQLNEFEEVSFSLIFESQLEQRVRSFMDLLEINYPINRYDEKGGRIRCQGRHDPIYGIRNLNDQYAGFVYPSISHSIQQQLLNLVDNDSDLFSKLSNFNRFPYFIGLLPTDLESARIATDHSNIFLRSANLFHEASYHDILIFSFNLEWEDL